MYKLSTRQTLTACSLLVGVLYISAHATFANSNDIHINEIGAFEPTGQEWIEIVNSGTDTVDMTGWKFVEAATNHGLTLTQGSDMMLSPHEYAIIAQDAAAFITTYPDVSARIFDSSWGTLNESGELIALRDASGNIVEEFTYVSATDFSLERIDTIADYTALNWKEHPTGHTAGAENYWTTYEQTEPIDLPPTAHITAPDSGVINTVISYDGSQSSDDRGILTYSWDLGDDTTQSGITIEHTYTVAGTYTVTLTVTDIALQPHTTNHTITIYQDATTTTSTDIGTVDDVRINEIVSDPQTGNEWIEFYNTSNESVSLEGCTLQDGVGVFASLQDTITAHGFFVHELSSAKLNNSGDIVQLTCNEIPIDTVAYGNWDDGDMSNNAPTPTKESSIIRIPDGTDTDTDAQDWQKTTTITKGTSNIASGITTQPTSGGGGTQTGTTATSYAPSTIVINEFVSDPGDGQTEFVELYNKTSAMIDIHLWYIQDGSEAKTSLVGTIAANGYVVIDTPKGQLNNAGDQITLYDGTDTEIDQVTYGTWDDGSLNDNAPAPNDPFSLARKANGQDADNDAYDFVKTDTITKGKANIFTNTTLSQTELQQTLAQAPANTQGIVINEIYPNPPGSDNDDEFIEIKNIGTETMSLSGWKLQDGSAGGGYTLPTTSLIPNGLLVITRAQSGIALNNSGGEDVRLSLANGALVTKVSYTGSVADAMSYSRTPDGTYVWSTSATPNKENVIVAKNSAPKVLFDADTDVLVGEIVSFDASDTTDSDTDTLTFVWDFGDGETETGDAVEHVYEKHGIYTATLRVTDSQKNTVEKRAVITVRDDEDDEIGLMSMQLPDGLRINELFPNPAGSDDGEFIELYNASSEVIDLSGLKLDDEDGGSRPFVFDDDTLIEPGEYRVFSKSDTKLALNNTTDSVRILDSSNAVLASVDYDGVIEGASYSLTIEDTWQWSSKPTPGAQNSSTLAKEKSAKKTTKAKTAGAALDISLDKIREEDVGDRVKVTGVVAVLPDVFGTQYFYIVGETTPPASGIQIYSYKKDFPRLSVGDVITVTGEISESSGETRIKTIQKEDMVLLGTTAILTALPIETTEIGESVEGAFIRVSGEVTEKKASYVYVDDGVGEIKVYFKKNTGITGSQFSVGQHISVSGIVGETRSGYQLMPRDSADIIYDQTTSDIHEIKSPDTTTGSVAETYLTATAGGLTSILIGLLARARGTMAVAFLKRTGTLVRTAIKIKRG